MKRGTKFSLEVKLSPIAINNIERVEFIFKNKRSHTADAVKIATYPDDVTFMGGSFFVPWDEEETYDVESKFYLDTRIHLKSANDIPETPIIELNMSPTLFNRGEHSWSK